jgi:glutamyl-tRNA reductase
MIGLLGLNHKSAPIEVRERFVFCEEDIKRFVNLLRDRGVLGAIVLSTCNRTEIYYEVEDNHPATDLAFFQEILSSYRKTDLNVGKYFYKMKNEEVARHLFTVVSGLDSMALGEYQIVGQIKDAYNISEKHKLHSTVLIRLFNTALKAGKRVRTETSLNEGAVSISYAAVELALKKLQNLPSHPVLLVGAGQTSELTLLHLIKKECTLFTIVNRTYEKACELAEKYNCEAKEFDKLEELLLENDIVITSTASKKPLFTESIVRKAMEARDNRTLFFLDLSVPRNVAHEIGDIENVHVFDIDALNGVIEENLEKRRGEISQAKEIIEEAVTEFVTWHHSRSLTETFQSICTCFHDLHKTELERFVKNKDEEEYEKAMEFGKLITNKFIALMVQSVKSVTDNGRQQEYIGVVNKLFKAN